jgi:hypothetical protein
MQITGVHAFRGYGGPYYQEHILLSQALSAYEWKKYNGEIQLYTTEKDLNFFEQIGLSVFYDKIDTTVLSEDNRIQWNHFLECSRVPVMQAVGKIPVAFLDNDFILFKKLPDNVLDFDAVFLRRETIESGFYPELSNLPKPDGYAFPGMVELQTSLPASSGFVLLNNQSLMHSYAEKAMDFMKGNPLPFVNKDEYFLTKIQTNDFVNQRLLAAVIDHTPGVKSRQLLKWNYNPDRVEEIESDSPWSHGEFLEKHHIFHLGREKSLHHIPAGGYLAALHFYRLLKCLLDSPVDALKQYGINVVSYMLERDKGGDRYGVKKYLKLLYESN